MWRKLTFALFSGILFVALTILALDFLFPLPPGKPYSLVVKDRNGKILRVFLADDGAWRMRTHPEEIPAKLKYILIKKEDRFFYYHPGINPFSVARALAQNIISGKRVSGASTITMQVARMMEPKERSYFNKIKEMFRAIQLEVHHSKNEILEMYLSMVPLGGNIEGLKSASLLYYQTPPERLNIAQLFDLILIPNDPNDFRPDRFPDKLYQERKRRALPWIHKGLLTQQDSSIIWQTPATAFRHQLPTYAPLFCSRVQDLPHTSDEVTSSLNKNIQQQVEALLSSHMQAWKQRGVPNGAVLVVDNRTHEILAYVGSENYDDVSAHGQVDAIKALGSPGSTLKPFLFAMQMDKGTLTPKSRLLDTPYDAEGFHAENYDGSYSGLIYADDALRRSLNVPMVRLLKNAGLEPFIHFAENAGFSSLHCQKDKLGLSVILGGCGVTLEELVAGYASFPNAGNYSPLVYIKQTSSKQEQRTVFSPSSAFMVTEILSGLDRPDLPNNFESSLNLPKVAFKTGTSYGRHDAWCIGYSAEYTVGVWIGNVAHKGNPEVTGGKAAAPLLIDIFNSISTSRQKSILKQPGDVLLREVCTNSGSLPTHRCTHVIEDWYSVRNTLQHYCEFDKEALVSLDGKNGYCPSCLGSNNYKTMIYPDYPAELLPFLEKTGLVYVTLPPHNPKCTQVFAGNGPTIISPSNEMTYFFLSAKQEITLQATAGIDVKENNWYVDDQFLKREKVSKQLFISLSSGDHTISCVDDKGRTSSVKITVKYAL